MLVYEDWNRKSEDCMGEVSTRIRITCYQDAGHYTSTESKL